MPQLPDSRYANEVGDPIDTYARPLSSNEERLTAQALQANSLPREALPALVRPPLPQVDPVPPRFGYDKEEPGIRDVINVDAIWNPTRSDFTGRVSGYSGTSYPSLNQF
jgi:hypothetical protein